MEFGLLVLVVIGLIIFVQRKDAKCRAEYKQWQKDMNLTDEQCNTRV